MVKKGGANMIRIRKRERMKLGSENNKVFCQAHK